MAKETSKETARKQEEEREYAKYAQELLQAHFAEDRNEFLTGDSIHIIGSIKPSSEARNARNK
jgi:hypothetical protein